MEHATMARTMIIIPMMQFVRKYCLEMGTEVLLAAVQMLMLASQNLMRTMAPEGQLPVTGTFPLRLCCQQLDCWLHLLAALLPTLIA